MTQMIGKSVRSSTANLTTIAKDWDCSMSSSGRGLTTPLMPQAGNHLNTLKMHLTWSRHSIRLIQISQPPKSFQGGNVLYFFLHYHSLNHLFVRIFLGLLFCFTSCNLITSWIPPLPPLLPSPSSDPLLPTPRLTTPTSPPVVTT